MTEGVHVEERKVALIPRVVVQGALGPKEYGVLLTDQRMIFVLERSSKAMLGGILGGAVGAAIAQGASTKRWVDYERADVQALAADEKNLSIPYTAVQELRLKRKFATYPLRLEYMTPQGKSKKMDSLVVPPAEQVTEGKRLGQKPKAVAEEYVKKVQGAFLQALPPALAQKAEWDL